MKKIINKLCAARFAFRVSQRKGQSLVELLLIIGLSAVVLPSLITGLVSSRNGKPQQNQRLQAATVLKETVEAVRTVREKGWSYVSTNGTYHPVIASNSWSLSSGSDNINGFTRQVVIADTNRSSTGQIVATGGTVDPSTKKITVTVSWTMPQVTTITSTFYVTRYLDNLTYAQTTKAEFDTDTLVQTATTNTSGGEVILANNTRAKWCEPSLLTQTIDLPDGPPISVDATASASTSTPNDTFVAVAPFATSSAKLTYVTVTANVDPPTSTIKGTFTLDSTKYSSGTFPTGINLDNSFSTRDVKYYKSSSGKKYALLATSKPDHEVVAVQIYDGSGDAYQDPVNHIYKYWTFFNTDIYSVAGNYDTGFKDPSANAAATGGDGDGFATNPTRAYTDNNSFAVDSNSGSNTGTNCTGSDKDRHRFYNYGFSIPSGATINGIEVRLDAKVDNTTGAPKMCVELSWDGGTTWTAVKSTNPLTTSEATYTLGGSADTWGRTWTDTNFSNANFRIRVTNVASNISRDFSLDWAPVKVYYSGGASGTNDQAPFDYGATSINVLDDRGYVTSGGYLYSFDLSNIDSKTPLNGLDMVGCRIQLDGYDCQPGNGTDKKYAAGETGTTWSDTTTPAHNNCSDGGNIELYGDNDISTVKVSGSNYIFVAVGAGTNPEFSIVNATSVPTTGSSPTISNSSCGRISGGNSGWKQISTYDFNSQSGTEEAANSVYAKSDGSRAYISSNGGIDGNGDGQPDSYQFYILNTSNKNTPTFLSGNPSSGPTSGYYSGNSSNIQLFPRRSLTVLNGDRAILVGKDGYPLDGTDPKDYQVLNIQPESTPSYCGGIDFNQGFNDLTSVSEADFDNFVYMVANTDNNELKIIQGGPDGTYADSGTVESPILNVGYATAFNNFVAHYSTPTNTALKFQFAIADPVSGSCTGANYVYTGPDGTNGTFYSTTSATLALNSSGSGYKNPAQCFRYKGYLSTTDYNQTPVLQDITVNYSP